MERLETKALVEAAIFAGVTALLGVIYYYMQYLGIIGMVWPVPVIIVGYRNGLKASILSALSAGLIVSLVTQPLVGVGLLAGFGIPGILMGYLLKRRVSPYAVVFLCGLVLSFTAIFEFLLMLKTLGIDAANIFARMDTTFNQSIEAALNMYRGMGIAEKDLQYLKDMLIQSVKMMKLVFPSGLVILGIVFSFMDYKLVRLILKRIGYVIPDIEEFSKWRFKEPYSFALLGLMVLVIAASYFKNPFLANAALNVSIVMMLIFSILGISVLVYYAKAYGDRNGIPNALRNIMVIIAIIVFFQFIAFVGILDLVLNFRKLES